MDEWAKHRLVRGDEIGKKLCEIFKIDYNKVQKISLNLNPDEVAQATITRFITHEESGKIVDVLEEYYRLVVRADD